MLQVKNLSKAIQGVSILNAVNFEVQKGAIACFLGGSGAGKSTLLRLLSGLEMPDEGFIQRSSVGMVFQHFNLFEHLSVKKNITLALQLKGDEVEEASCIADKLLEKYGLAGKQHEAVGSLSGGQKQRLALARTLALNPELVLLDEPTSALDPLLTGQVASSIQDLANDGHTIVLSTHDLGLVALLDCHLYFLHHGRIVEEASKNDFGLRPEEYPYLHSYYPKKKP